MCVRIIKCSIENNDIVNLGDNDDVVVRNGNPYKTVMFFVRIFIMLKLRRWVYKNEKSY